MDYLLEGDKLMIRKGCPVSLETIFREYGVIGKIIETLGNETVVLDGERCAVKVFRVEVIELSAEDKKLADELHVKQVEAARIDRAAKFEALRARAIIIAHGTPF